MPPNTLEYPIVFKLGENAPANFIDPVVFAEKIDSGVVTAAGLPLCVFSGNHCFSIPTPASLKVGRNSAKKSSTGEVSSPAFAGGPATWIL